MHVIKGIIEDLDIVQEWPSVGSIASDRTAWTAQWTVSMKTLP
jgi:hypothetical protein